ncbi:MAG: ribose-5-phosphate isomerase RpiA [Planctomycetes bacterium]|nr:ribose-5-phosphate isomerase RpiA [Planctomycetota bacterium]
MTLGLGTGSTVHFSLLRLAERIRSEGLRVRGVPTSLDTERKAREWGIPLVDLGAVESLDLGIDGADEIDPSFRMVKGGGGALLREKVVATLARRMVIVVGEGKVVPKLGTSFALPVEVVPFAVPSVARAIARLCCTPKERRHAGQSYRTDNGNAVLDCSFASGIEDPEGLERTLRTIPGIVESGLFLGLAHVLVVGKNDGTLQVRER